MRIRDRAWVGLGLALGLRLWLGLGFGFSFCFIFRFMLRVGFIDVVSGMFIIRYILV